MPLNALIIAVTLLVAHGMVGPATAWACSCLAHAIWSSDPAEGASDVPLNQALVVEGFLSPGSVKLEDSNGAQVEFALEHGPTPGCQGTWAELQPRRPLAPMTQYRIRVASSQPFPITPDRNLVTFTTGTRLLPERDLTPPKGKARVVDGLPQSGVSCGPTTVMTCIALDDYADVELIARRGDEVVLRWLFHEGFTGYPNFGSSVVPDCLEFRRRAATGQRSAPLTLCGEALNRRSADAGDSTFACHAEIFGAEPTTSDAAQGTQGDAGANVSQSEANDASDAEPSGDGCSAGRGAHGPSAASALWLLLAATGWRASRKRQLVCGVAVLLSLVACAGENAGPRKEWDSGKEGVPSSDEADSGSASDHDPAPVGPDLNTIPPGDPVPGDDAEDFVSHVPGQSSGGATSLDAGAAATPASAAGGAGAARVIAEADILHRDGDTLYALSRYAGLTVIDIANPKQLTLLGHYRSNAQPFEMYVRNGVVYILYNNYSRYEFDAQTSAYVYTSRSQVSAIDVSDPANIKLIGEQAVPGSISDSRLVGDVLYLVTFENGHCWSCASKANTRVASFDVSEPAHFEKIDELSFEDMQLGGYQRSISVTTQRIYVGGPSWSDRDSNIQVVDIADPAGDLKLGATIPIHGSVASRWQMDEHEGILRVISQPTQWRTNDPPHVQTFRVNSSSEVTPLASLPIQLPRPERLESVRFDGTRAYAITAERIDPLFTFDLSDPARPRQMGELEIPGFVYHMEPRGDRLYALGFDNAASAGSLHVSIFDVSDMRAPTMLSRVNFGGSWSSVAEDQDRIHKAFGVLLDQGLILVPFSGGRYDASGCRYKYLSGIQLIDVNGDALTLRGVALRWGARDAPSHTATTCSVSPTTRSRCSISRTATSRPPSRSSTWRGTFHTSA